MKLRLVVPFAAMLFGLSACVIIEEGPYMGYPGEFAVGAPLYGAGGPVTWHYYDGYTYHLIDYSGRFVGYAYYDYDHFYRIADIYGNIVYYLRWYDQGWRIHDHRNFHVGFIHVGGQGRHWIADRRGHRYSAMRGWGNSGRHGHAHAGNHDKRVDRRDSRRRHDAERNRWRDRKRDASIRQRQQRAVEQREQDVRVRIKRNDRQRLEERNFEKEQRKLWNKRDRSGKKNKSRKQNTGNRDKPPAEMHDDDPKLERRDRDRKDYRSNVRGERRTQELNVRSAPAPEPALAASSTAPVQPKAKQRRRGYEDARQPRRAERAPAAQKPRAAPKAAPAATPRPKARAAAPARAKPRRQQAAPVAKATPAVKPKGEKPAAKPKSKKSDSGKENRRDKMESRRHKH